MNVAAHMSYERRPHLHSVITWPSPDEGLVFLWDRKLKNLCPEFTLSSYLPGWCWWNVQINHDEAKDTDELKALIFSSNPGVGWSRKAAAVKPFFFFFYSSQRDIRSCSAVLCPAQFERPSHRDTNFPASFPAHSGLDHNICLSVGHSYKDP